MGLLQVSRDAPHLKQRWVDALVNVDTIVNIIDNNDEVRLDKEKWDAMLDDMKLPKGTFSERIKRVEEIVVRLKAEEKHETSAVAAAIWHAQTKGYSLRQEGRGDEMDTRKLGRRLHHLTAKRPKIVRRYRTMYARCRSEISKLRRLQGLPPMRPTVRRGEDMSWMRAPRGKCPDIFPAPGAVKAVEAPGAPVRRRRKRNRGRADDDGVAPQRRRLDSDPHPSRWAGHLAPASASAPSPPQSPPPSPSPRARAQSRSSRPLTSPAPAPVSVSPPAQPAPPAPSMNPKDYPATPPSGQMAGVGPISMSFGAAKSAAPQEEQQSMQVGESFVQLADSVACTMMAEWLVNERQGGREPTKSQFELRIGTMVARNMISDEQRDAAIEELESFAANGWNGVYGPRDDSAGDDAMEE